MIRYEILVLTTPEITNDEAKQLESQVDGVLRENSAALISFERWGKYRLAYPVRDNEYGVYFLVRFEVSEKSVHELLAAVRALLAVKNNELVMRHLVSYLDSRSPLAYHRPESLEEAPVRDVDTFLKESKMVGLLDKSGRGRRSPVQQESTEEVAQVIEEVDETEVE